MITPIQGHDLVQGEAAETSDLLMLEELSDSISAIEPKKANESAFLDSQLDQVNSEDQLSLFVKKCMENYSSLKIKHEVLVDKHKLLHAATKQLLGKLADLKNKSKEIKVLFTTLLQQLIENLYSNILSCPQLQHSLKAKQVLLGEALEKMKEWQRNKVKERTYSGQQVLNKSEESQDLFATVDRGKIELVAKELCINKDALAVESPYEKARLNEHNKENIKERISRDNNCNNH